MKTSLFTSEFSIYKINKAENLYIAIPQAFTRIIRQYVLEYEDLLSVPPDKKVTGIVFKDMNSYNRSVETKQQVTNISINQLAFEG